MSRYPLLTNLRIGGYDWHTDEPVKGQVVVVPGDEPANVILTFPTLVEAPVALEPILYSGITPEEWLAAGLDPVRQAPLWMCPSGLQLDVRSNCYASEYEYSQYNGHPAARFKNDLPYGGITYTTGQPFEPGIDFLVMKCEFALVTLQEMLLPAGRYVFRRDVRIIPRSLTYDDSPGTPIPELCNNRNLVNHPEFPSQTIEVVCIVPDNLTLADVTRVDPPEARPGDEIRLSGSRLDHTTRVMFSPGIPAQFRIESESLLTVRVPEQSVTGLLVVETGLGWVLVADPFRVVPVGPAVASGTDLVF